MQAPLNRQTTDIILLIFVKSRYTERIEAIRTYTTCIYPHFA